MQRFKLMLKNFKLAIIYLTMRQMFYLDTPGIL